VAEKKEELVVRHGIPVSPERWANFGFAIGEREFWVGDPLFVTQSLEWSCVCI